MPEIADKKIRFTDLTDGRLAKHDVGVIVDKPDADKLSAATLFHGMSIVLVRADEQGFVSIIEPVQINGEDVPHIAAAIEYEFAALFTRL